MPLVTPSVESIAQVLIDRDGLDPERARIAASISGGHVGRARRLATDESARDERQRSLRLAADAIGASTAYKAAENLVKSIELTPRRSMPNSRNRNSRNSRFPWVVVEPAREQPGLCADRLV